MKNYFVAQFLPNEGWSIEPLMEKEQAIKHYENMLKVEKPENLFVGKFILGTKLF